MTRALDKRPPIPNIWRGDTANEPAAQKATFLSLMAVKDYKIVGSAWVTTDTGCLVKYAIDLEQDEKNGSVKKTHFEGNVTKRE
jgi:hypothetical protein